MNRSVLALSGFAALTVVAAACSSTSSGGGVTFTGGGTAGTSGGGTGGLVVGGGGTPSGGGSFNIGGADTDGGGVGGGNANCSSGATEDKDQDGFTKQDGDCNDCDPNVSPGAIDTEHTDDGGAPYWGDEDCDGKPGSTGQQPCDDNLALEDVDPVNAAKSIEICTKAEGKKAGLISAQWVRADGSAFASPGQQVGIQPGFGTAVNTQGGKRLLAISSGRARTPGQTGACGSESCSANTGVSAPPGFPQDTAGCAGDTEINDDVALEVKLRAPTNATGYAFSFRFYSFEYPEWVCTSFNDQFIALVSPAPTGAINGNICFDSKNNPVTVNVGFFDVCGGCPAGTTDLAGTGFDTWDDAGATVWLNTQAPVKGGEEVSIRFTIWDTGDQAWDSTSLIDNFRWIVSGGTVDVGTTPIPVPK